MSYDARRFSFINQSFGFLLGCALKKTSSWEKLIELSKVKLNPNQKEFVENMIATFQTEHGRPNESFYSVSKDQVNWINWLHSKYVERSEKW